MVSNQERRSAAVRLRMMARADYPGSFVFVVKTATDCYGDWRLLCKRLAELIDRPLCEPLFYEANETGDGFAPSDKQNATFVQCGNCGARLYWASAYDNPLPHYCHNCGAEVER